MLILGVDELSYGYTATGLPLTLVGAASIGLSSYIFFIHDWSRGLPAPGSAGVMMQRRGLEPAQAYGPGIKLRF